MGKASFILTCILSAFITPLGEAQVTPASALTLNLQDVNTLQVKWRQDQTLRATVVITNSDGTTSTVTLPADVNWLQYPINSNIQGIVNTFYTVTVSLSDGTSSSTGIAASIDTGQPYLFQLFPNFGEGTLEGAVPFRTRLTYWSNESANSPLVTSDQPLIPYTSQGPDQGGTISYEVQATSLSTIPISVKSNGLYSNSLPVPVSQSVKIRMDSDLYSDFGVDYDDDSNDERGLPGEDMYLWWTGGSAHTVIVCDLADNYCQYFERPANNQVYVTLAYCHTYGVWANNGDEDGGYQTVDFTCPTKPTNVNVIANTDGSTLHVSFDAEVGHYKYIVIDGEVSSTIYSSTTWVDIPVAIANNHQVSVQNGISSMQISEPVVVNLQTFKPKITGISLNSSNSTIVRLTGNHFGSQQSISSLNISGGTVSILSWVDDEIDFSGSASGDVSVTVDAKTSNSVPIPTVIPGTQQSVTLSMVASPNPALVGTATVLSTRVSPVQATGTVSIYDNGNLLGAQTLTSGVAVFTMSNLGVGVHPLIASYSGDSVFSPNTSQVISVTVASPISLGGSNALYSFSITDQSNHTGYAPNGNIIAYSDSVNGQWNLGYDNLNRIISSSRSTTSGAPSWGCWLYDGYGNMLTQGISNQPFANASNCMPQLETITLQNRFIYNTGNQITSGTWLDAAKNTHSGTPLYDADGNMINDLVNNYLYDPDGNICAIQTGPSSFMGYLYNAEGQRVAKGTVPSLTCDPTSLQITEAYFIGPNGETMTELQGNGQWIRTEVLAAGQHLATYTPTGQHLPIADWLGNKRLTVNPNFTLNNGLEESCTSYPFGDQLNCSTSIDASPKHFTGKENDNETGLDFFGARYYASGFGRFMSPDSISVTPIRLVNPQRLNKYSYVINKPLTFVDVDGREAIQFKLVVDIAARATYFPLPALGGLKLEHSFTVETDASKSSSAIVPNSEFKYVGPSLGIGFKLDGALDTCVGLCAGQASSDRISASAVRNDNGEVSVTLSDRVSYPLAPSPDIDVELAIQIKSNGTITYNGTVTRFPRITLYEKREGGSWHQVFQTNPWTRNVFTRTPLFLFSHEPIYKTSGRILP